jgi:hypothetical protein
MESRIYSTRDDGNAGSTAPETMETQDLQHQRRWKPRIYSTRGDYLFADLFIARLSYPIETLINVT